MEMERVYEISVIIPAYNVDKYIDECFDSLLNQTFKKFEIIVINDGSTDSTRYMLEKYAEFMNNLTIVNQNNSGSPGGPRNKGIELAKGKYIFMLDPDDVLPYSALEKLYIAAEKSEADITCGNYIRFNSKRAWTVRHISKPLFSEERKIKFKECLNLLDNGVTCNKLYRTDFIKKFNIRYDETMKNGEDKPFMLDAYYFSNYIYIIPDIVYKYREREDKNNKSTTQELNLDIFIQSLKAIEDNYNSLIEKDAKDYTKGLFSKERVQHDLIRFINYYTTKGYSKEEWDKIFDICSNYINIIKEVESTLPYMQRLKIEYIRKRDYVELTSIYEKERKIYYYSLDKVNNEWIINDKRALPHTQIVNKNDLDLKYKIDSINIKELSLYIDGWAYFNRTNVEEKYDIKKYIVFKNSKGQIEKELEVYKRNDINLSRGKGLFNYDWSGIKGNININDIISIIDQDNSEVKIFLKLLMSDNLYEEVHIENLDIYNYINRKSKQVIQRIDRIYLEQDGIRILGWANLLYFNNENPKEYIKKLICINMDTNEEYEYYTINKFNRWYNEQFETNPYKFNYDFGGWECTIPYKILKPGKYKFYIEIIGNGISIRKRIQYVSNYLIKNRLNSEKKVVKFQKTYKFELTTSEYSRELCEVELFVDTINKEYNQILGGYCPTIGQKLLMWDLNENENEMLLNRILVTYEELIFQGQYNKDSINIEKLNFVISSKIKGIKKIYKPLKIEKIYNTIITNGWEVRIPYNQENDIYEMKMVINDNLDKTICDKFIITDNLNNNRDIWNRMHYIGTTELKFIKEKFINSEKVSIEIEWNNSYNNYIKGFTRKVLKVKKNFFEKIYKKLKLRKIMNKIQKKLYPKIYPMLNLLPCNNKKVIMLGYQQNITPNFKPIYDKLRNEHSEIKVKYIGGNQKSTNELLQLLYHIATAKTIILNDYYRHIYPLCINKRTKVIQIWHATGIFKKFGLLALGKNDSNDKEFEINAHKSYTNVIVSSEYVRKPYAQAFGVPIEHVLSLGVPRTDIFFDAEYRLKIKNELFEKFPQFKNKKIILYAPTFRGNPNERKVFRNQIDFKEFYRLNDSEYILLYKLHPIVKESIEIPINMRHFVYDMTRYSDINKLFIISDILITDYSSNIFEFALMNKPIILFAYDLEKYLLERGFYDDYEEMVPGPICRNTRELVENILNIKDYTSKQEEFIKKYVGSCDGKSTDRIIDLIINN